MTARWLILSFFAPMSLYVTHDSCCFFICHLKQTLLWTFCNSIHHCHTAAVLLITYLPTYLLTYLLLLSYTGRNLRDFQHLSHILKEWSTSLHLQKLYMARDLWITLGDPRGFWTEAPNKKGEGRRLCTVSFFSCYLFSVLNKFPRVAATEGSVQRTVDQPQLTLWSSLWCHRVQAWQIQ